MAGSISHLGWVQTTGTQGPPGIPGAANITSATLNSLIIGQGGIFATGSSTWAQSTDGNTLIGPQLRSTDLTPSYVVVSDGSSNIVSSLDITVPLLNTLAGSNTGTTLQTQINTLSAEISGLPTFGTLTPNDVLYVTPGGAIQTNADIVFGTSPNSVTVNATDVTLEGTVAIDGTGTLGVGIYGATSGTGAADLWGNAGNNPGSISILGGNDTNPANNTVLIRGGLSNGGGITVGNSTDTVTITSTTGPAISTLTASSAIACDSSKRVVSVPNVTATQVGYLTNLTANVPNITGLVNNQFLVATSGTAADSTSALTLSGTTTVATELQATNLTASTVLSSDASKNIVSASSLANVSLDSAASGTINIGHTSSSGNATTINIGNSASTTTLFGTVSGVSVISGTAGTIPVTKSGGTTIGDSSAYAGTVTLDTAASQTLALGNTNATTINIGQTAATGINIGRTGCTTAFSGTVTGIAPSFSGLTTGDVVVALTSSTVGTTQPTTLVVDSASSGTIQLGHTNATTISIGNSSSATTISGGGTTTVNGYSGNTAGTVGTVNIIGNSDSNSTAASAVNIIGTEGTTSGSGTVTIEGSNSGASGSLVLYGYNGGGANAVVGAVTITANTDAGSTAASTVTITGAQGTSSATGTVTVQGATSAATGALNIYGYNGTTAGTGGSINISGNAYTSSTEPGGSNNVFIQGANSSASGGAGAVKIQGNASSGSGGGEVIIYGGGSSTAADNTVFISGANTSSIGGTVTISGGESSTSSNNQILFGTSSYNQAVNYNVNTCTDAVITYEFKITGITSAGSASYSVAYPTGLTFAKIRSMNAIIATGDASGTIVVPNNFNVGYDFEFGSNTTTGFNITTGASWSQTGTAYIWCIATP